MDAFQELPDKVTELVKSFNSSAAFGDSSLNTLAITQYTFFMFVGIILMLVVFFKFKKKQSESLVPNGRFVNGVEFLVEFVRDDLCKGIMGKGLWRRHFPFIATMFFFVLFNNILGIIPGLHPGTGTIGVTAALAVVSFIYFVVMGVRARGGWGYIKSLAPAGLPAPMAILIWVIELFSTLLRPITLAIRLFCNMYAGHIVMGTFAILASLFFEPLLQQVTAAAFGGAVVSAAWIAVLIIIYLVEILVAVIQAYVFALLSAVYVSSAEDVEES